MKRIALVLLLLGSIPALSQVASPNPKPRVRAITAFVRLDRTNFHKQVEEAVVVLRRVESQFNALGYNVQTVRITT